MCWDKREKKITAIFQMCWTFRIRETVTTNLWQVIVMGRRMERWERTEHKTHRVLRLSVVSLPWDLTRNARHRRSTVYFTIWYLFSTFNYLSMDVREYFVSVFHRKLDCAAAAATHRSRLSNVNNICINFFPFGSLFRSRLLFLIDSISSFTCALVVFETRNSKHVHLMQISRFVFFFVSTFHVCFFFCLNSVACVWASEWVSMCL